jgi:HK97 family phage prohead protease
MQLKTLPLSELSLKFASDKPEEKGWAFVGYGSKFNGVDSYGDTILPGAYQKVLRAIKAGQARMPKMLLNHNRWALPIGKWTSIKEDDEGLLLDGSLIKGMSIAADVRAAMVAEAVDGFSIGYSLKAGDYEDIEENGQWKGRIIKSIHRLDEVSVVTFPADDDARTVSLKSEFEGLTTLAECEERLRDVGRPFTKAEATAIVSAIKRIANSGRGDPAPPKASAELDEVRRLIIANTVNLALNT